MDCAYCNKKIKPGKEVPLKTTLFGMASLLNFKNFCSKKCKSGYVKSK